MTSGYDPSARDSRSQSTRVTFDGRELEDWLSWLPKELGDRLTRIREHVADVWASTENTKRQMKWYTPHGREHFRQVERYMHRLIPGDRHRELGEYEKFLLLASAWLHDLGMLRGILPGDSNISDEELRENHHIRTGTYLGENHAFVAVEDTEVTAFAHLAKFHRRRCPLVECPEYLNVSGRDVRLRLLAAYLRLADALHVDVSRAPGDQYAIMLTYDIPNSYKVHWLRSRFVSGIEINHVEKTIELQLKQPRLARGSMQLKPEQLARVYEQIRSDLADELNTVKDILFRWGISYFLKVESRVITVEVDEPQFRDIKSAFAFYFLMETPSSSSLFRLLLEAVDGILEANAESGDAIPKGERATRALGQIRSLLEEVRVGVLASRGSHTGLQSVVKEIERHASEGDVETLSAWTKEELGILEKRRRGIQERAAICFEEYLRRGIFEQSGDSKVNFLLFGYSEQVTLALRGFRDALIRARLQENLAGSSGSPPAGVSMEALEQLNRWASGQFRLFVCEGQPKNQTSWGGRLVFHDGLRFAQLLESHGFSELYVVPDAVATSLIMGFDADQGMPEIDLVLVGTNGYDDERFRHSAGHAMVVCGSRFKRAVSQSGKVGSKATKLILVASTDKFVRGAVQDGVTVPGGILRREGWRFRGAFGSEPVRTQMFISQDPELKKRLMDEEGNILLYNPREDNLPIDFVDVVISERSWLARDREERWDGTSIAGGEGGLPS